MTPKNSKRAAAAVLTLFIAAWLIFSWCGCSGPAPPVRYTREGKTYGVVSGAFRHRWWNYYERGLSFAEGNFYKEAIADLRQAIRRRDKDQRMARTYGMHFIDYFPNRELGIIYWERHELERAREYLERSNAQWPSAKARYYLDRVRRDLILRREEPPPAPQIRVDTGASEIWTRQDPVNLSGIVTDDNYVAAVRVNGRLLFQEHAQKAFRFSEALRLAQGTHSIAVSAENLGGRSARRELVFHVDRAGPLITLKQVRPGAGADGTALRITGSVYDPAGLDSVRVGGKAMALSGSRKFEFEAIVAGDKEGVCLAARDRLGNATATECARLAGAKTSAAPILVASRNLLGIPLGGSGNNDDRPPAIELKGWSKTQTVYLETVYLEGRVIDESRVAELSVNASPILRSQGKMIAFGHLLRLKEGKNRFVVEARDDSGNARKLEIEIVRKVPDALQLDQRLSLTIVPFDLRGTLSELGISFQDYLIEALVNRNRFRVVERSLLETILKEQEFSQTALVEQSTALRLGRLAAAHAIVAGSLVESRNGIEILARMIDVETSEILTAQDVYSESRDWASMRDLAKGLAVKFHREFPVVTGIVVKKEGKNIFTDLGGKKLGCQNRLLIYREHPVEHPLSGKVIGSDTQILNEARVRQVDAQMTKAELVEPEKEAVRKLDKVITQ